MPQFIQTDVPCPVCGKGLTQHSPYSKSYVCEQDEFTHRGGERQYRMTPAGLVPETFESDNTAEFPLKG